MFAMDLPPDMPAQYAPIVIAQASQAQKGDAKVDRTIGVCHLIDARPSERLSAVNVTSPLGVASVYLEKQEHRKLDWKSWKVSVLQGSKHGELKVTPSGNYRYYPTPDYRGSDRATFLVEIGDRKVKVRYFFKVMQSTPPGMEGYDPHENKKLCPQGKGRVWKISLNPDDPGGGLTGFKPSFALTQALDGVSKPKLVFADHLPRDAVGETKGNTITLDTNAAGTTVKSIQAQLDAVLV